MYTWPEPPEGEGSDPPELKLFELALLLGAVVVFVLIILGMIVVVSRA